MPPPLSGSPLKIQISQNLTPTDCDAPSDENLTREFCSKIVSGCVNNKLVSNKEFGDGHNFGTPSDFGCATDPEKIPVNQRLAIRSTRYLPAVPDALHTRFFLLRHTLHQSPVLLQPAHTHPRVARVHLFLGGFVIASRHDLAVVHPHALARAFSDNAHTHQVPIVIIPKPAWVPQQNAQRRSAAPRGTP